MLSHMHATKTLPAKVEVLYTTKADSKHPDPGHILFLPRLNRIAEENPGRVELTFFLTGKFGRMENPTEFPWHHTRRIEKLDLHHALGADSKAWEGTVCFVCGPPEMTDELVGFLGKQVGKERVFCEKWW
jgi:NAD(P)H-flavin reductase